MHPEPRAPPCDVRRGGIDGRRHRLGRQSRRRRGQPASDTAKQIAGAARSPRWVTAGTISGAPSPCTRSAPRAPSRDGETACPPATCEHLRLLGDAATSPASGRLESAAASASLGVTRRSTGNWGRAPGVWIPDDLAARSAAPARRGRRRARHPAAVVGDEHDGCLGERTSHARAEHPDLTAGGTAVDTEQRVLATADADLLCGRAVASQVEHGDALVLEAGEQLDARRVVGYGGEEASRFALPARRAWRPGRRRPDRSSASRDRTAPGRARRGRAGRPDPRCRGRAAHLRRRATGSCHEPDTIVEAHGSVDLHTQQVDHHLVDLLDGRGPPGGRRR